MESVTPAAGAASAASMRREIGGLLMHEKFPCIVCSSMRNSIQELHNHQKDNHTTEELSLSIICLVHHMCLRNVDALRSNSAYSERLDSPLGSRGSNRCGDILSSTIERTGYRSFVKNTIMPICDKRLTIKTQNLYSSLISAENLLRNDGYDDDESANLRATNADVDKARNRFISSLEMELRAVEEINDETFFKCVKGICEDLEILDKLHGAAPGCAEKKQNRSMPTNQRDPSRNRKRKRMAGFKENAPYLTETRTKTKGLKRLQTRAELPVVCRSGENIIGETQRDNVMKPIDCGSTNNYKVEFQSSGVSLRGFCQRSQFMKYKRNNGIEPREESRAEQSHGQRNYGSQNTRQDLGPTKLPVLEKFFHDFKCEREIEQMPALEPQSPIRL